MTTTTPEAAHTLIDLLRHGEPEGGVLIRGWRDDPLSPTGWEQMRSTVGDAAPWQHVVSSPLVRCAAFADELAGRLGIPVTREERLRELGFGAWEGLDPARLYRDDPQAVTGFWDDPTAHPPPGGEPFDRFQSRVIAGFEGVRERFQGQHVLLVIHGGVIRMLLAHILGMPPANLFRMEVPYAAASRIRVEEGVPRLSFHCGCF